MLLPSQQKFFDDESKAKILTIFGGVGVSTIPTFVGFNRDSE